jgi:acetyltransferase
MERGGERIKEEKRKMTEQYSQFSNFFYSENIAVIGVSSGESNLGKNIVQNLLSFGYQGEIISIGRRRDVVFGQKVYQSIEEVDRDIHLAVILTPAKTIPEILEQCGRKGIKWAVIESSGFSEMGKEGRPLENACTEVAKRYGIRFIGPNGIGLINMENGIALPFVQLRKDISSGPVSILAQSGGVGLSYIGLLAEENIGLNKFVSLGNKLDVDENDLLDYLIHDEGTRIILLYLEGFSDGRRFIEIASKSKKPVLVHKSNRFKASARIAHSHTAALFADDKLTDHALRQAGCVRVNTIDDAVDYIKILTLPPLRGNRLAVVSRSGGYAVIAADACGYYGFHLPHLPADFLKRFESRFRAHVIRLQNPLDLGDLFELEFYEYIVKEMLKREDVDGVLLGHGYRRGFKQEAEASRVMLKKVEQLVETYQKPVAPVILTEAVERDYLKRHLKIPIFSAPENAMRALSLSHKWASRRPSSMEVPSITGVDHREAKDILDNTEGEGYLLLKESFDLLKSYRFSLPEYGLAKTAEEAIRVWHTLNCPVAMKINRPYISHKSDSGAVRLHLGSEDQIRRAFQDLQDMTGKETEVIIQSMVSKGREVILGGKRDEIFGPVVLFGLGGIFVETIEDVVWHLAPISLVGARDMIQGIKGKKILNGVRGEPPHDTNVIEDFLVRLSRMLVDFPMIREIDINPVKVFFEGEGAQAVDVRVILNQT